MKEVERILKKDAFRDYSLAEEVRDGFVVTEHRKKIWLVQMDMLKIILDLCKENNLKCWMAFGALLGAVRHKGYIPWDDDLDICLPRCDYDVLINLCKEKLKDPYFLQVTGTEKFYTDNMIARLCNSNTTGIRHTLRGNTTCNKGIFLDIFPLDSVSNINWITYLISHVISIRKIVANAYVYNCNPSIITKLIHKILHLSIIHYDLVKAYKRTNRIASMWSDKSDKVAVMSHVPYKIKRRIFKKEDFKNTLWLPFGNMLVPVPSGYDNILKTIYNNYMEFPPIEVRGKWHDIIFEPDIPYKEYYRINKL